MSSPDLSTASNSRGTLIAFIAVIVLSPDGLLIRLIDTDTWTLVFYRGAGLGLTVLAALALIHRGGLAQKTLAIGWAGAGVTACFTVGSILFIVSIQHTSVANTLAIIGFGPLLTAILSYFWLHEKIEFRTWMAALLAIGCIGVIVSGSIGSVHIWGDLAAMINTFVWALSLVLIRQAKGVDMLPAMVLHGIATALIALLVSPPAAVAGVQLVYTLVLCLIILPLSFALITIAPRFIAVPELKMILLLEMLLGPLFVWWGVHEKPPTETLIGGGLIFLVLAIHAVLGLKSTRPGSERTPVEYL